MKKITFIAALFVAFTMSAQYSEGFDDITTLEGDGWTFVNVSDNVAGATNPDFFQGVDANFPSFEGTDSYLSVNFNSTAGTVIDNWAILPTMSLINGDTFTFYTRTATASNFPDALQVRVSLDGDASTLPTSTDVGSFTTLALDINPDLTIGGYPEDWELQTVTIEGADTATDIRIAFRYYIPTSAGPTGNNSNLIGIDSAAIDSSLSLEDNNIEGLSSFVSNDILTIEARSPLENITIYNVLGQAVINKAGGNTTERVNLSNLKSGVYIATVQTEGKVTPIKFVR